MKTIYIDILTLLIFMIGIIGFLQGEFIISSALFAASTYVSSASMNKKAQSRYQDQANKA